MIFEWKGFCVLTPLASSTSGQRIQALRQQLALTRSLFEEKTGISQNTLEAWEKDRLPLLPRTAVLLSQAFATLKVQVSDQYLLTGTGTLPVFIQEQSSLLPSLDESININREIEFFKKTHPSSLILKITDETMAPAFNTEDIVAGYATRHVQQFPLFLGRLCLIETPAREKFLRKVLEVEERVAKVSILNPHTLSTLPTVQKLKIHAIAQVTRHWCLNNRVELMLKSEGSF